MTAKTDNDDRLTVRQKLQRERDEAQTPRGTWYLLFDGESADGRGEGRYIGRTTELETARQHHLKCKANWYSTGFVLLVTDTTHWRVWEESDFNRNKTAPRKG